MGAYWDTFGEIFGMPMRVANTTATTRADLDEIERIMASMGAASYGVFPEVRPSALRRPAEVTPTTSMTSVWSAVTRSYLRSSSTRR